MGLFVSFVLQTSSINHLQEAFKEARSYARYHPSKGYTFEFKSLNGQVIFRDEGMHAHKLLLIVMSIYIYVLIENANDNLKCVPPLES